MVTAYNIAVRRLYNTLFERGVSDPHTVDARRF